MLTGIDDQCFTYSHSVCFTFVFSGDVSTFRRHFLDGVFQICSPDSLHDEYDIIIFMIFYCQ